MKIIVNSTRQIFIDLTIVLRSSLRDIRAILRKRKRRDNLLTDYKENRYHLVP